MWHEELAFEARSEREHHESMVKFRAERLAKIRFNRKLNLILETIKSWVL